jgi:hypothetical protein
MKSHSVMSWRALTENRFKPLKNLEFGSRQDVIETLCWLWGTIFSLAFLCMYALGYTWLSQMLLLAGVFITFAILKPANSRRVQRTPAPYLSRASKCVWQMDREA